MFDRPDFLRTVPFLDATRRVATSVLSVAAPQVSSMTLIPALVRGGILFAAVIALVALRRPRLSAGSGSASLAVPAGRSAASSCSTAASP